MRSHLILCLCSLAAAAIIPTESIPSRRFLSTPAVCAQIDPLITGDVYLPFSLSLNYLQAKEHYMTSSTQTPLCVVEVASAQDISAVLKVIGQTKTPFAVKSGGHASNPGFSSTTGVMISLVRLKKVAVSADRTSVEIGTGNRWTDVYGALASTGLAVVGGRVTGPGVGGFTLGGGFSWLTNQYGLTVDTVISFNAVLPNGTITTVTATSNPDLFFALKGGLNRFGIVSSVTLKAFPQAHKVWGGLRTYTALEMPKLIKATERFQLENTDDKAQVILTINGGLAPFAILIMFYDGPTKPAAYQVFDGLISLTDSTSTKAYVDFVKESPSQLAAGARGAFHTLSTSSLTEPFIKAVFNESLHYSKFAFLRGVTLLSYDVEPFTNFGRHATDSGWPHANSPLPLNLYFSWQGANNDAFWRKSMQTSINYLTEVAKREGIWRADQYAYPNYALDVYGGDQLYGPVNAAKLRRIRGEVDPNNVMLLAGGFTI